MSDALSDWDFDALEFEELRRRSGRKWGLIENDLIPAWIADMDFEPAPAIRAAIESLVETGDLGYPPEPTKNGLAELFCKRMSLRFDWETHPDEVRLAADVVQAIETVILLYNAGGDGVVVQTPIYPPFLRAVGGCRRRLVENPLVRTGDGWEMDFDHLVSVLDQGTKVLMLCNPHNPTGRSFRRAELETLADIVLEYDLLVIADEIHQDLVFKEAWHTPFASLSPQIAWRTVTMTSATKAFNIAGLACAFVHIANKNIRADFDDLPPRVLGRLNRVGIEATRAAWTQSDDWAQAVVPYLQANRDAVASFVGERLDGIDHVPPEATYLAWLDCRKRDLGPSPAEFLRREARVWLSDGADFGEPGEGFVRLNFATSRPILEEILERIAKALDTAS